MASLVLLLLTATIAFFVHVDAACETGWQLFGKNCFLFRNRKVHEFLAEMECQRNGGTLATITSEEKLEFLKVEEAVLANGGEFWVGLHVTQEGHPYWNDYISTPAVNISMSGYHRMETNCFAYYNGTIQAVNCRKQLTFVCEQPAVTVETVCPTGTSNSHLSNLCFWSSMKLNWTDAKAECAKSGGDVCGYRELLRGGFRLITANYISSHYWIKGTFKDESHNETTAPKCHTIKFNPNTVVLYIQDECDNGYNVLCYIQSDNTTAITYEDTELQFETEPYLLTETAETVTDSNYVCPHGYNWKEDKATGMCFWETSYEAPRRSWEEAQTFCQSYGGNLASFHNINDERMGLSFQYGTMQHPYWIGLKYNYSAMAYQWIDGTILDYQNWGPGEPKDYEYRRKCVQMNALSTYWIAAYCGQISWFICKAPKQILPVHFVVPTLPPREYCSGASDDLFYNGNCYSFSTSKFSWHRASLACGNSGYRLLSIHSYDELDFLLRMFNTANGISFDMVWIGLTTFASNGDIRWNDGTPFDFAHWNLNESLEDSLPINTCVTMNVSTGLWSKQNCGLNLKYICKKRNGTQSGNTPATSTTTPLPPVVGNCEDGWYALGDRCYSLFGADDPKDWSGAVTSCATRNAKLASVRNLEEQALLSFMIQDLKQSPWIGLHDQLIEGIFFWADQSQLTFTNFAPGEPSFHQLEEDCVSIGYESAPSGSWYANNCSLLKPYICLKGKNASVSEYRLPKQNRCPYPEGWLRLGMSCYKFFNTSENFHTATLTCAGYNSRLVSVSDLSIETAVKYLSLTGNTSFWIGLIAEEDLSIRWSNEKPLSISRWDYNEPSLRRNYQNCFASSKRGYWSKNDCNIKLPYICQTTSEQTTPPNPTKRGFCPSNLWSDLGGENCYIFNAEVQTNWYEGSMKCNREGGSLASIHSMEEIELLKKNIDSEIGIHIALTRNENGGFMWKDGSAVDFVYWDQGEPSDNNSSYCVSMLPNTLKWRVRKCYDRGNYLCQIPKKILPNAEQSQSDESKSNKDDFSRLSGGAIAAIVLSLLILFVGVIAVYVMYPRLVEKYRTKAYFRASSQVVGFENALYKGEFDETLHNKNDSSLLMED